MHDGWQHIPAQIEADLQQRYCQSGAEWTDEVSNDTAGCSNPLHGLHRQGAPLSTVTSTLPVPMPMIPKPPSSCLRSHPGAPFACRSLYALYMKSMSMNHVTCKDSVRKRPAEMRLTWLLA